MGNQKRFKNGEKCAKRKQKLLKTTEWVEKKALFDVNGFLMNCNYNKLSSG